MAQLEYKYPLLEKHVMVNRNKLKHICHTAQKTCHSLTARKVRHCYASFLMLLSEFFSIIESKKSQNNFESNRVKSPTPSKAKSQKSLFYERASQASRELQNTAEALEKLTSCTFKKKNQTSLTIS